MKSKTFAFSALALNLLFVGWGASSFGGEDVGTTAKNSASDVSTAGKKTARWASRQARKLTGQNSQSKSQADRLKNREDELQNNANKAENLAKENQ